MTRDTPYLDPLLTLPRLALKTGTTANTLSAVLNQHLGVNFFDFVNGYRVDDAARLLLACPDRTVLDIAMEVGFNSKSTFNAAFKKHTGTTPSAWRKTGSVVNA
ncbi:helix-turn-helix domain-containing protein [Novispirillum itersonii]|uniref:AraC-like DNA-binding protein n=1 Tax=Novispirillum itersonii TaxID=189 RepID=A0A7W9ZHJ3_NOVIT|nr:helix-turn-helix domain-containing protein [Novispirillum itersonii]MBB6211570.1 AraC-like DNA-binding protein [Novispirillum itersonii]